MIDLYGISPEADQLIINEETGGQAYYEKTERHPTWPGGMSGVTIGNGYDLGYSTKANIAADWGPFLTANAIAALQSVSGIHGSPASSHAHELHWIDVPWDAAMAVFHERDLPKWVDIVRRVLPNCGKLNGDCLGAIVSLAFNRGPSFDQSGARYTEMRNIKQHMGMMQFDKIPADFRSMKRLWPVGGDLWRRREHEAVLFEKGLAAMSGVAPAPQQSAPILQPSPEQPCAPSPSEPMP